MLLTLVCFSQSPKFPNLGWSDDELGISVIALEISSMRFSSSLLVSICSEVSKEKEMIYIEYSINVFYV
jgi:hypothetical protein